jgi:hypothetical protein
MTNETEEVVDILGAEDLSVYKDFFQTEETPEETPAETPTETPTDTPPPPIETKPAGWLEEFNKSFETNYRSVDEVKSIFGANTKTEEIEALRSQNDTIKAREQKLIEIVKQIQDPQSFFAEEAEFKKNLLLKSNPSVNKDVAGKIFTVDVENANPLDLIVLDMQVSHKRLVGGEAGARETLLAELGIDADFQLEDLTTAQKNQINIRAEKAAQNIVALRDSVQIPQPLKDIESILQEIQPHQAVEYDMTKWDGKIDSVISKVDFIEIKDGNDVLYKEAIDDDYRNGLKDALAEVIKGKGIDPTPENIKGLVEEAKDFYLKENLPQILKRHKNQIIAEHDKAIHSKLHNDTDPDKQTTVVKPVSNKATDMWKLMGLEKPRGK